MAESPVALEPAAAAPVATVADFAQVSDMSERDKRSRLKSRGQAESDAVDSAVHGLSSFLVALVIAALTARVTMQESELEEAKQQEVENRKRLERRAAQEKYNKKDDACHNDSQSGRDS